MSKLGQRRKKMGYGANVPRCGNCAEFVKPYVYLTTDSITKRSNPSCKIGEFTVQPNACCDMWAGNDGTSLAASPLPTQQESA